jgi:hypothetical protein
VEVVITQFKTNVQKDEEAGGHADRQSNDVDKRKYFMTPEFAERHF